MWKWWIYKFCMPNLEISIFGIRNYSACQILKFQYSSYYKGWCSIYQVNIRTIVKYICTVVSFYRSPPNILDEWNGYTEIFSFCQALEISRQYVLLRTVILQKKVSGCPCKNVRSSGWRNLGQVPPIGDHRTHEKFS